MKATRPSGSEPRFWWIPGWLIGTCLPVHTEGCHRVLGSPREAQPSSGTPRLVPSLPPVPCPPHLLWASGMGGCRRVPVADIPQAFAKWPGPLAGFAPTAPPVGSFLSKQLVVPCPQLSSLFRLMWALTCDWVALLEAHSHQTIKPKGIGTSNNHKGNRSGSG